MHPLKKFWSKGRAQFHMWMRTPDGGTIDWETSEATFAPSSPEMKAFRLALHIGMGAKGELAKVVNKHLGFKVTKKAITAGTLGRERTDTVMRMLLESITEEEILAILDRGVPKDRKKS